MIGNRSFVTSISASRSAALLFGRSFLLLGPRPRPRRGPPRLNDTIRSWLREIGSSPYRGASVVPFVTVAGAGATRLARDWPGRLTGSTMISIFMGRSKVANAERKGWNEDICQLNVLSGLEVVRRKRIRLRSNDSDWLHTSCHNANFLPQWISPWYLRTHKGDGAMTKTVVSVTVRGGIDSRARRHWNAQGLARLEGTKMATGFSVRLPVSLLADVRSSSHLGDNRMKTTSAPARHRRERYNTKMKEWSILTPIN